MRRLLTAGLLLSLSGCASFSSLFQASADVRVWVRCYSDTGKLAFSLVATSTSPAVIDVRPEHPISPRSRCKVVTEAGAGVETK